MGDVEDKVVATTASCCIAGNVSVGVCQQVSEARLVADAKRGDQRAFGELCERHHKRILRTTLRITRNREDAEDALQDCLLSAFVHIHKFDGRSTFYTWLTRVAINSALMKLRKNRGCREISIDEPADAGEERPRREPVDAAPNPEARYVQRERESIVRAAVGRLRPTIRRALEIRHLQDSSIKQTAEILGISLEATKGRLFHARLVLRRAHRLVTLGQSRVRKAA
jgi:RNA polymerase sigma-70 factor (ECF subfamily)